MKLCAISSKECWRNGEQRWYSSGGFPLQMAAVGSLFHEMTLLVVEVQPKSGGIPLPPQARVIPLPKPNGADARRKLSVLLTLPRYWRVMWKHCREADVVHVPLPGDLPLLGMIACLLSRTRLIARYGGSWVSNVRTTKMNQITRGCMRLFAGGRNVMLATGEGSAPPAPGMEWVFSTAWSGEELARIQPIFDRRISRPARLVYVGRLSPEKGLPTLIRALVQLRSDGLEPAPHVTLAGDGPERTALQRLVKELGAEEQVQFVGQLDRTALSQLLLQADLCVQPSFTEGYSKAWLDAMAHGLPVVASEVGAARNVIGRDGERGWLVPPGQVAALAETLKQVFHAEIDWPALRRRCRQFVEGKTLEAWGHTIGSICATQWKLQFVEGKLGR